MNTKNEKPRGAYCWVSSSISSDNWEEEVHRTAKKASDQTNPIAAFIDIRIMNTRREKRSMASEMSVSRAVRKNLRVQSTQSKSYAARKDLRGPPTQSKVSQSGTICADRPVSRKVEKKSRIFPDLPTFSRYGLDSEIYHTMI
jgi:hypothetical protein